MKRMRRWGVLAAFAVLLAPRAARAQRFAPVLYSTTYFAKVIAGKPAPEGQQLPFKRLQVGAYLAMWDLYQPATPPGIQSIEINTDPSILLTADYYINRQFSIGGWWNPMKETIQVTPTGGVPFDQQHGKDNFYDLHVAYSPTFVPGLTLQVGYSSIKFKLTDLTTGTGISPDFNRHSYNVWAQYSHPVGTFEKRPIGAFVSVGRYTGDKGQFFNKAWNLMGGASVPVGKNLDLSASYWLFDFKNSSSRYTAGLTGHF